jgi:hypothetical protein
MPSNIFLSSNSPKRLPWDENTLLQCTRGLEGSNSNSNLKRSVQQRLGDRTDLKDPRNSKMTSNFLYVIRKDLSKENIYTSLGYT